MKTLYTIIAALILGAYAYAGFNGKEFPTTKRQRIAPQPGVRGATGGGIFYRGYQGGK